MEATEKKAWSPYLAGALGGVRGQGSQMDDRNHLGRKPTQQVKRLDKDLGPMLD